MTATLAATLACLVLQLALGIWLSRRIASEADYLIAGQAAGVTAPFLLSLAGALAVYLGGSALGQLARSPAVGAAS